MQRVRDHILAGSCLALDEHIDIGIGDLSHGLAQPSYGWGFADQGIAFVGPDRRLSQATIFQYELTLFDCTLNPAPQSFARERLGQEVVGAVVHGLHGGLDVAMARNHDDWDIGVDGPYPGK